jgi:2,5-furandicarboxylate decarboxylase 1
MNKDLHSFLKDIERLGPSHYVRVSKPVDSDYEPCVIQQKLAATGRYPVIQFDRVNGSSLPLVTNLFGSYELLGLALGIDPGEPKGRILETFRRRIEKPMPVKTISASEAPVKEIIWNDIDLSRLPIPKHAEKDSGKYFTIAFLVVRDPETGIINAGVYRHEIKGKDSFACMFNPSHNAGYIYRRHKELKRPMEAVLVVGHHPAAVMGSLLRGSMETDELEMMGALLGEPLEVVRAETVDLPVPAWAEIAIEGVIDPSAETSDGPFAEYTGFYGPAKDPVALMRVNAVTMRKDAIFHDLDPAHREHNLAGVLPYEASVFDSVKKLVPSAQDIYMPASGSCYFTAYVRIKKRVPGEGKSAGLAAIAADANLKMAIVVDDDVDIYREEEVLWAIATHCEADRDLSVITNAMGAHLNPAAYGEVRHQHGSMNSKLIIDATRPATLPFAERIKPPAEAWNRIRLEDYLS